MDDVFKIYVEQLREGREEKIREKLNPDFLEVHESYLIFDKPVDLEGSAYLADQELILHWDIRTEVVIPCSICNEPVRIPLHISNFYYSEPISEIKSGIYNFKNLLRETILLEAPSFTECHSGNCPGRLEFQKYLKEPSNPSLDGEEGYHPFSDLDWEK